MARRRLTTRQARHVQRIQERRLTRAQRRAQASEQRAGPDPLGPERIGRVIANFGGSVRLEDENRRTVNCVVRANLGLPVCGDRVVWQPDSANEGVVTALMPRTSVLARPDFNGHLKPLAANLDRIFVVTAPVPILDEPLIDRYLVAAELAQITPLLVVNKIDLLDAPQLAAVGRQMAVFEQVGYRVIYASTRQAHRLDALMDELVGHTSILVGQSGVGKSSLIKALLPDRAIRIGALSGASGQGVHTTTATMLYHVPHGGDLIDSAGVREFGLSDRDPARLAQGFIEFRPYLGRCQFRDCRHGVEPGCAIRHAVTMGRIDARRLASYERIVGTA